MTPSERGWVLRIAARQYWMCMLSIVDQRLLHWWIGLRYYLGTLSARYCKERKVNTYYYYPWALLVVQQSNWNIEIHLSSPV